MGRGDEIATLKSGVEKEIYHGSEEKSGAQG
jgi:hypothetical protein